MWHSYPRCTIGMGGCSHPPPMVRRVYTKTTISRDIAMLQILNPLRPGDTYMSENWVIVGSPYGLSQRQAINLANADLSSIWSLWINVKEITIYNRFLPVGLKSNLWERQGTPYVYGSSGLSCSGGSTRNRIVGVRTHPHRVAYPTQTHHWASGWHPVTKAIQKTHIPWLNAISELPSHHNTCVVDCFRYVRQVCRHYWRVLLQSSSKW